LSCWNYEDSGVEIVTELNAIVNQNIEGEEGKNGEQLFQYVSDNLVAEILINPQHSTLVQCVRNLLASFTKYRCIIHAGYSFTENGSWILQDGSFSVTDFLDAYKTAEAQRTIRLHENYIRIDLHCSADADWNQVSRLKGTRFLLNPPEKIVDNESIESTVRWLCDKIEVVELDILLEGSQVVGNIRFSRPTLYVFPAGQGDSALFGINGFNMLIDGGAGRNSCFWGFARHLDRLDAVLLTRLNSTNLEGVASFLKRKTMSSLYPQIGHFFCNFKTRKQISSPNTDAKQDVLSISLIDTAQTIITDLKQLQLRPHLCYRNINLEPINLYHKVGHGKLDMYVLNPSKDSKEVKDFLTKWNEGDQKLFYPTKDLQFPLPNIISVCTLLVWQPANPNTTITRIFFPGSSPQNKIFESLERVRHLEFLKHPSCSIKSMSSSTSVTVKSQTTKKTVLEKMIPGETKTLKTMENLEVSTSATNSVIQTAIIPTVPKEGAPKTKFPVETEKSKANLKTVTKETVNSKTKVEHKYSSISAKVNSNKVIQKSTTIKKTLKLSSKSPPTDKSSPTTPIENQEKTPKPIKQVIKPKSTITTIKSPSSTPTKSKKEEANRKVLVSSRTNSGLKRTQLAKKEIKPAKPISEIETGGNSLKKDSNIVYKSSLISCDKDKSGEEEDILIVEKVAITPEKLLTPDGKKIIANELDGILTTAKDIVIKEKYVEKLSDSGATTAPTMPEDEKITDSKKETEVIESDQKTQEFKKAKDALKTPDEVADLPFHEEVDNHKIKVTEKVIETAIESQEIVQVENAEYVLVSLDSSPEALKRQVLDNVNLLDTELEEESDKEDEYVEKKESKLIEHLLESSKDLCEITDKIDELKKQNENDINNHLIHDNLQNYSHNNTETTNVSTELIDREKQIQIQENEKSRGCLCDETLQTLIKETITTATNVVSRSGSTTAEQDTVSEHIRETNESKVSTKPDSIYNEQVQSSLNKTITSSSKVTSRSGSFTDDQAKTTKISENKKDSKASSKAGSVCDDRVKSPVHETITSSTKITSRSGSISTYEQDKTPDKLESKASSKEGSVFDEPVKSPVHETITSSTDVASRSGSITIDEHEKTLDKLETKASSKAGSVCDEPVKSPVHETITSSSKVPSRSSSITTDKREETIEITDGKKDSKASSKASSVGDELMKSPLHETITSSTNVASRSGSISRDEQDKNPDKLESKASSKAGSVCEEPVKSPVDETIPSSTTLTSRSGSITTDKQEETTEISDDKKDSKASSKAGSVCDEPVKSPVHETITSSTNVASRSGSISRDEQDKNPDKLESKASSKAGSVCDEPEKSPVHETITSSTNVASRSESITIDEHEKTLDKLESKASSKAGSICEDSVKSPVDKIIPSSSTLTSRSDSITTDKQEETTEISDDKKDSKASSMAGSVCDEPAKSLVCETIASDKIKTMTSSFIAQDPHHDNQCSKVSSKASSTCEKPLKSLELEINTVVDELSSRSSSINQDQDIIYNSLTDKQEFNASSIETGSSSHREPITIDDLEINTNERVISCITNSEEELLESVPNNNKHSNLENTISDISFKEQEIVSTSLKSKSNSICQDTECTPISAMDKYDIETSSRIDAFCQDKNESTTISSSSTSSICQEINTQSSKLSSRKSSIIDELIDKPSKLQIGEKSSSLQESNIYDHNIDDNSKIFNKSGSLCDEMLNMSFNKVTENVVLNKACERTVSPTFIVEKTECKIDNKVGSVCEEPMKSSNNKTCNEGSNFIVKQVEESKSLGRIGSLCEEIAKFLTDDDKKISTYNTSESSCGIVESTLKNSIEVLKVETESLLQFEKNNYDLNKIEKPLQLDDEVKVSEKHDHINEKNTDHSLPAENITVSNNKSSDISTISIEENNKTGVMNVAQMIGKNINDESFTKHTAITDNESKSLKTVNPISNITSEECISKLSNVLIEDVVKSSNEKNIMNNSSLTDICVNQPLGVTLNSEDLGVTKDIVMQLKRDVHEALHQCSSDDERPYTPQSESSMSRSAMNIDEDDDDNEDNKIETDDDMAGSPMSTGPSPIQMQLDNRQVEINIDFNKAIQEHRITRGEDLTTNEANGNHVTEIKTTEHDNINQNQSTSSDTVQSWGKPLGLPPIQSINNNGFDPIREWGKPLGLPSPTQPVLELGETQNVSSKTTPKKLKKIMDNKPIINVMDKDAQNRIRRSESPSKLRSRSSSRMSRINPVYLDLIYVPHHGNSKYVSADFFKRVRARNYVFSGTDPSKEVLNALIEGKQAWEDQDLEVTIIPTYDTDTLGQWVSENEELLTKLKIDLSPSASRCTIKLQDHNTSCSAYRLEF
ncbi:Uncharacterized protein FWK35_00009332, partial [Aphis craccivora]